MSQDNTQPTAEDELEEKEILGEPQDNAENLPEHIDPQIPNPEIPAPNPPPVEEKENEYDLSLYELKDYEINNFRKLLNGSISNMEGQIILKYRQQLDTFRDKLQDRKPYYQSLIVDFDDLKYLDQLPEGVDADVKNIYTVQEKFAIYPDMIREVFEHVLSDELILRYTKSIVGDGPFYIRFYNFKSEIQGFEMVKSEKMSRFIEIRGEIIRIGGIYPKSRITVFRCKKCGSFTSVTQNIDGQYIPPPKCDSAVCQNKTPIREWEYVEPLTKNMEYQHYMIQEPFDVAYKRNRKEPRPIHVFATADAVDIITSEKKYKITGVLKGTPMGFNFYEPTFKTPLFDKGLWVSHIEPIEKTVKSSTKFTPEMCEDKVSIVKDGHRYYGDFRDKNLPLFKTQYYMEELIPQIRTKRQAWKEEFNALIASKITGGYTIKMIKNGMRLVLTGACEWISADGQQHRRKEIHALLAGDPGTGKSSIGKSVINFKENARYTSTTSASGIGLIGSVEKDEFSPIKDSFCLKPGALALSSGSILVIDEFDKFDEKNREKLLEQMEHGTIHIDKASIHEVLIADCTDIALANPVNGRFDFEKTFMQNLSSISPPVMSRFDLRFFVYGIDRRTKQGDKVLSPIELEELQRKHDDEITGFSLSRGHPERYADGNDDEDGLGDPLVKEVTEENISEMQDKLEFAKYYLQYTDKKVEERRNKALNKRGEEPIILTKKAFLMLKEFYLHIKSPSYGEYNTGIAIDNRQIESLERLAIADAKFYLSPVATSENAQESIDIMKASLESISFDFGINGLADLSQFDSPQGKGIQVQNQEKKQVQILADLLQTYPNGVTKEVYGQKLVEFGLVKAKGKKPLPELAEKVIEGLQITGYIDRDGSYYILSKTGKELVGVQKTSKKQPKEIPVSPSHDDVQSLVDDIMNKKK